jgi:hypothetical protein
MIIISGIVDPTLGDGIEAEMGTTYFKTNSNQIYIKIDNSTPTLWELSGLIDRSNYVPSDPTKWASPQPITLSEAIDRMAAVIGLSTPIAP